LRGNSPLGKPRIDGSMILRLTFRKWNVGIWPGSSWHRTERVSGHLLMRLLTFEFHKILRIYLLIWKWEASQEGLYCME